MSFKRNHVTIAPTGVASENHSTALRICDLYVCMDAEGAYESRSVDRENATGALWIMREMKTKTESPTDPVSAEASLSTATDEADENEAAAPREIPSARAWKSRPTKVENAGDLESRGSRDIDSLSLRTLDDDAATVK
jgi:hypothetical protein